jgi:hypothetical protein
MSEATTPVRDSSRASLIGPRVNCSRRTPQPCLRDTYVLFAKNQSHFATRGARVRPAVQYGKPCPADQSVLVDPPGFGGLPARRSAVDKGRRAAASSG